MTTAGISPEIGYTPKRSIGPEAPEAGRKVTDDPHDTQILNLSKIYRTAAGEELCHAEPGCGEAEVPNCF